MDNVPGDNMVGRWNGQASQKTTNISGSLLLYAQIALEDSLWLSQNSLI